MEYLKGYTGNLILPFGKPTSLVFAEEIGIELYCERITFYETIKGKIIRSVGAMKVNKLEWKTYQEFLNSELKDEEILLSFLEDEGIQMVEADIYGIIEGLINENYSYGLSEVKLVENKNVISTIMYIRRKFPDQLLWLKDHTKSASLIKLVRIAEGITTYNIQ